MNNVDNDMEVTANTTLEVQTKNNDNLSEIDELRTLNVWSECQDVLEQQALKELEIFAEQNCSVQPSQLEDGEIIEQSIKSPRQIGDSSLNLDVYIKRQEELKKQLEYKRSLQTVYNNKKIAEYSTSYNLKRKSEGLEAHKTGPGKLRKLEVNDPVSVVIADRSGSEYAPSGPDEYNSDSDCKAESNIKTIRNKKLQIERVIDDGCYKLYKCRLKEYYRQLESADDPLEILSDINISGLKVPVKMWNNLYGYQQEGVEWLWNIHQQKSGGLLGDEMGLGKTVQVIVFLAALEHSKVYSSYVGLGPTLIVVPATVIHQWVKHFHEWAPEFRVAVLHHSGSFSDTNRTHLIKDINKSKGILITTYSGVLRYKGTIADYQWHYLILDEGHKIRNHCAKVSIAVKQIRTPHRIMLTGSPMQNNLQELWSLFDFIVPGMLGTLPTFVEHFNNPIVQGGFTNATPMQEATALSVATALKNIISPYLLRRTKTEVRDDICLPNKSEQVLFCSLTEEQHDLYKSFLMSEDVSMILGRGGKNWFSEKRTRANVLVAITTLRKICNHPDLYLGEEENNYVSTFNNMLRSEESHGYYKRSGKMIVVSALLKIWKKQQHRVLLFTQARAMIGVFETFLTQEGYTYLKMDGSTSISARQPLINKFNNDSSYDVFLSTTRVGGLGINLTGANRVIIYDPDWNPATDTQARERAWRIGQEKQVTIYRLVSAGTIEEKMYQRQVWKQLLCNKVLIDPRTQKFFKTSDLHDLFSLPDRIDESNLETANIFKNSRVNLQEKIDIKKKLKISETSTETSAFSDEKLHAMKNLAHQIAKSISSSPLPPDVKEKPTLYQKELEEERLNRLKNKESLKKLTPLQLRMINRQKMDAPIEHAVNKMDDSETVITFSKALEVAEKTSKLYNCLKSKKISDIVAPCNSTVLNTEATIKQVSIIEKHNLKKSGIVKNKKHRTKKKNRVVVDASHKIDGEHVEGLLKTEIEKKDKLKRKRSSCKTAKQDDYVLGKLFTKKGVYSALEHDVIMQSGYKDNNIKIHYEAQQRTDIALQALKKSRLEAWHW